MAESKSDFRITIGQSTSDYLPSLTGELWCVYREGLGENLPRYDGTVLYHAPVEADAHPYGVEGK